MEVRAVSWVGVKTQAPGAMVDFFENVMGLRMALDEPSFAVLTLPSGDKMEVFGPDGPDPPHQFAQNPIVIGFLVDDIDAASAKLRDAGTELLGPKHTTADGYAWQHFRGPDSLVFSLAYDPRRLGRVEGTGGSGHPAEADEQDVG